MAKGEKVRAVGRNAERLKALVAAGAEPFTADLIDAASAAKAFAGAKAVYVMIPPNVTTSDVRSYETRVVDEIAAAIRDCGATHAVTLSSMGAEKPEKTGPVVGRHYLEETLNAIGGLNVLHLRAGYFRENTLVGIGFPD